MARALRARLSKLANELLIKQPPSFIHVWYTFILKGGYHLNRVHQGGSGEMSYSAKAKFRAFSLFLGGGVTYSYLNVADTM